MMWASEQPPLGAEVAAYPRPVSETVKGKG